MTVVIDSDVFIDLLRGVKAAKGFILELKHKEDATCFSAITEAELIAGKSCSKSEHREEVLELLSFHRKIVVDNKIALLAGDLRRECGISLTDSIIASTALNENAELVTRNAKDYEKVQGLKIRKPPY